jgi:hypothetical protein
MGTYKISFTPSLASLKQSILHGHNHCSHQTVTILNDTTLTIVERDKNHYFQLPLREKYLTLTKQINNISFSYPHSENRINQHPQHIQKVLKDRLEHKNLFSNWEHHSETYTKILIQLLHLPATYFWAKQVTYNCDTGALLLASALRSMGYPTVIAHGVPKQSGKSYQTHTWNLVWYNNQWNTIDLVLGWNPESLYEKFLFLGIVEEEFKEVNYFHGHTLLIERSLVQ